MKYAYLLSHVMQIISVGSRDETVLQYIDILQCLLLHYNTTWLKGNIDILHIAIYCNVCCLDGINTESLHHKNDWTSKNDYTLQFLILLCGYTGCIFFALLPKPKYPYEMSFYQNPIKYCNMAIYCNTLKHNTQYSIDLYCFTPSWQSALSIAEINYSTNSICTNFIILCINFLLYKHGLSRD